MELLKKENVQICDRAADWKEAVRTAVKPLEKHGYVEPRYKEELISNVEKMGPYIVITEQLIDSRSDCSAPCKTGAGGAKDADWRNLISERCDL